jgi:hypothetical protein
LIALIVLLNKSHRKKTELNLSLFLRGRPSNVRFREQSGHQGLSEARQLLTDTVEKVVEIIGES